MLNVEGAKRNSRLAQLQERWDQEAAEAAKQKKNEWANLAAGTLARKRPEHLKQLITVNHEIMEVDQARRSAQLRRSQTASSGQTQESNNKISRHHRRSASTSSQDGGNESGDTGVESSGKRIPLTGSIARLLAQARRKLRTERKPTSPTAQFLNAPLDRKGLSPGKFRVCLMSAFVASRR